MDELAFPTGNPTHGGHSGMTLLDYFAGQALVGLLSQPDIYEVTPLEIAAAAYGMADTMMDMRPQNQEKNANE